MVRMARADDHGRNTGLIEDPPDGHGANRRLVTRGDPAQRGEQLLETVPPPDAVTPTMSNSVARRTRA